jgi:hypothetical protein
MIYVKKPNFSHLSLFHWIPMVAMFCISASILQAQSWQQEVAYEIEAELDPRIHMVRGIEKLSYTNHSPDTLKKVYFHLYWNAFQPNSMMDVRSRTIPDPDPRVGNRISNLRESEQGFMNVVQLKQSGKKLKFIEEGTILSVELDKPIAPQSKVRFDLEFVAQVPLQIRRSGRMNEEGIDYSMSQWYPKICAYDQDGWHANPYVGREFYGTFGSFDVNLTLPSKYIVGATGILQNPESTSPRHGYWPRDSFPTNTDKEEETTWHFKADSVHDFVWAADPDYQHDVYPSDCGVDLHFFYLPDTAYAEKWKRIPPVINRVLTYANEHFGEYPYSSYSIIQGGDGGMEYPMATLITGDRSFSSLVGVSVHELMHSWYQGVIATDEGQYAWMDEGMTTYASGEIMNFLREEGLIPGDPVDDPQAPRVTGHNRLVQSTIMEPMITPADHFNTNTAYGIISYTSGAFLIHQLGYLIGNQARDQALLDYYEQWQFKHPRPRDLFRVMEEASGIELHWYMQYSLYMTEKEVDYSIDSLTRAEQGSIIHLSNLGKKPMPLDVVVKTTAGEEYLYHIPLRVMRGHKDLSEMPYEFTEAMDPWPWTHPSYELTLSLSLDNIQTVTIDPSKRLSDIDREDNIWPLVEEETAE